MAACVRVRARACACGEPALGFCFVPPDMLRHRSCGTPVLLPRAFLLFEEMRVRGVTTGEGTYHDLVAACCEANSLDKAVEVLGRMREGRVVPSVVRCAWFRPAGHVQLCFAFFSCNVVAVDVAAPANVVPRV